MTLGEFREQTKDLPDDTVILTDDGELNMYDTGIRRVLPATPTQAVAIILDMGQCWNYELDIDARLDKELE